nr:hypothetical protein [Tanacetum cinerariifolium]
MNEQTSDPLALISQHQLSRTTYPHHQPLYQQSQFQPQATSYQSSPYSSAPQIAYAQLDQQSSEYSPPEAGLVIQVFQKGDDPIDAINHMMSFVPSVVASRYPATNNQLRTSSNPRQQATINNGRDKEEHRANKGLSRVITAKSKVTCPSSAQTKEEA